MSELISVIVPVYNVSKFLDRCIDTIVTQTYKNLEIILIDDGSTDNSGKLCDKWVNRDDRIKVIHQKNGGLSAARNTGIDIAKGCYIMFVDSDDYLKMDICQTLYDAIVDYKSDCAVCGFVSIDENGVLGEKKVISDVQVMSGVQSIRERYLNNNNNYTIVEAWAKLYRKNMWESLRYTPGIYYEDLDIAPQLFYECKRIAFVPYVGYYYYQRSGSISRGSGTDDKRYTDSVLIRQKHIHFYNEIGEHDLAVVMARRLIDLIITSACNGWIPESAQKESCAIFDDCVHMIKKNRKLTLKEAVRYSSFKLLGAKGYRKLILRK